MSSEARVMPMPAAIQDEKKRRGPKPGGAKDKSVSRVLFYLGDGGDPEGHRLVLKEEYSSEGDAMVESLKRNVPYYRIEVWQARAIVKEGTVEIKKEQVSVRT
jgi:hypothetical protein